MIYFIDRAIGGRFILRLVKDGAGSDHIGTLAQVRNTVRMLRMLGYRRSLGLPFKARVGAS